MFPKDFRILPLTQEMREEAIQVVSSSFEYNELLSKGVTLEEHIMYFTPVVEQAIQDGISFVLVDENSKIICYMILQDWMSQQIDMQSVLDKIPQVAAIGHCIEILMEKLQPDIGGENIVPGTVVRLVLGGTKPEYQAQQFLRRLLFTCYALVKAMGYRYLISETANPKILASSIKYGIGTIYKHIDVTSPDDVGSVTASFFKHLPKGYKMSIIACDLVIPSRL
jgi:hypothetical protein